jgi:hypothetical protein
MLRKSLGDDSDTSTHAKHDGRLCLGVGVASEATIELTQLRDCDRAVSLRQYLECSGDLFGSPKAGSYSGFRSYGSIACMFVIMGAFPRLENVQERADGAVEAGDGACGKLAQVRLEFAVRQFDRVEVG